jgi:hypothetical protein
MRIDPQPCHCEIVYLTATEKGNVLNGLGHITVDTCGGFLPNPPKRYTSGIIRGQLSESHQRPRGRPPPTTFASDCLVQVLLSQMGFRTLGA